MATDLLKLTPTPTVHDPGTPIGKSSAPGGALAADFQKIFGEQLAELVEVSQETARLDREFAAGVEGVSIDDVMVSAAKSGLALEAAMQVRNLAFRAFQTLTQVR